MGMCVCVYVWMRVFKLNQARNVKRCVFFFIKYVYEVLDGLCDWV